MHNPFIYVCLTVALLLAADDTATKVQEFAPKGGRFTIQMPGNPEEQTNKVNTVAGPIEVHMFTVSPDRSTLYGVGYGDSAVMNTKPESDILDGARDGVVRNVKGKLDSEKKITIDKYPGRDFLVVIKGGVVRERAYLVKDRLYQVIFVSSSREFATGKDADKFLDSFKLTEK